jgi:hypothetical protein
MTNSEDRSIVITHETAEPEWQHWVKRIHGSWQKAVESIVETGKLLLEAKAELNHGEFIRMIEKHLPFKARTAERLMKIAEHPVISNPTHCVAFPPSWGTLYELTKLPPKILEARIIDGSVNPKMERKDVAKLVPRGKMTRKHVGELDRKHKAKMAPILKLKQENEELEHEKADLEERLANAEVAPEPLWHHLFKECPVKMIVMRIISEVNDEERAKAIAAGIVKHYRKPPGRPKKAKPEGSALNEEMWRDQWLADNPGKTAADYREFVSDDNNSEYWKWRRSVGEASIAAERAAWLVDHPGNPLPEHMCSLSESEAKEYDEWLLKRKPGRPGNTEH